MYRGYVQLDGGEGVLDGCQLFVCGCLTGRGGWRGVGHVRVFDALLCGLVMVKAQVRDCVPHHIADLVFGGALVNDGLDEGEGCVNGVLQGGAIIEMGFEVGLGGVHHEILETMVAHFAMYNVNTIIC